MGAFLLDPILTYTGVRGNLIMQLSYSIMQLSYSFIHSFIHSFLHTGIDLRGI